MRDIHLPEAPFREASSDLAEPSTPIPDPVATASQGAPALGLAALTSAVLTACGGGDDTPGSTNGGGQGRAQAQSIGWFTPFTVPNATQAWRLLLQGTMGPTPEDLALFTGSNALTYDNWIDQQTSTTTSPQTRLLDKVRFNGSTSTGYRPHAQEPGATHYVHRDHVFDAWWHAAVKGKDQLRQRVAFALSEIFVVSMVSVSDLPYGIAHFHDMLAEGAFGSLKTLLKGVCLHPAMGNMLSHLGNWPLKQPGQTAPWGNRPDQNFARELLQLFTIGLHELNANGTQVLVNNKPVETYTSKDVEIISSIFTGWGWDRTGSLHPERGFDIGFVEIFDEQPQIKPMAAFPDIHEEFTHPLFAQVAGDRIIARDATSVTVRLFAGRNTTNGSFDSTVKLVVRDPAGNLDRLLTTLMRHPNVAPFIARQMIQRLVTSNPSAAYLEWVADRFRESGYSLRTLVRSVLLDNEAINPPAAGNAAKDYYGKVREPVLRMTHMLRAFKAQSFSGYFAVTDTSNASHWLPSARLGQAPLMAPSVFNFFRPGYTHPGTVSTSTTRVAPEMQITNENSVAGYIYAVSRVLEFGFGRWTNPARPGNPAIRMPGVSFPDPQADARDGREDIELDLRSEHGLVSSDPTGGTLATSLNQKLFGGRMPTELRNLLLGSIQEITGNTTAPNLAAARVRTAILLAMVSPDFIVQQ